MEKMGASAKVLISCSAAATGISAAANIHYVASENIYKDKKERWVEARLMTIHGLWTCMMLLFAVAIIGCRQVSEDFSGEASQIMDSELSELQIVACQTASSAGSCGTRLGEVGIVTKEACCQVLGYCCRGGSN